jgi:hypothetical protein
MPDPVLRWALGRSGPARDPVHRLWRRPRFHRNCRCQVIEVAIGDEVWEAVVTMPTACPLCKAIAQARWREIDQARQGVLTKWLGSNECPDIEVEHLPEGVDVGSVMRVYSHLKRLLEECPRAVPKGGIRLSFRPMGRNEFAEWIEAEHRLNLSPRWFGSQSGLTNLERRLLRLEREGASPKGCHTPEYVVTHEYGHCLRHRLSGPRYAHWWSGANKDGLGVEGGESYSEGFAEGFSVTRHVPPEQWPQAVRSLDAMLREDGVR